MENQLTLASNKERVTNNASISDLCFMSLEIASLNSGSNGNCYYVGNDSEAVLIDAGLSCKETEKRMEGLGLEMEKVKAIFISHEHIDHIRGISTLSKKYKLPVYITPPTYRNSGVRIAVDLQYTFSEEIAVPIGGLSVMPFSKHHDAADPYSFVVEYAGVRAGVFTDIGKTCRRVIHYFRQCHACFLESNYDDRMLEEGGYSTRLKKRIRGGNGHLSNAQALELFEKHRPAYMSHLLLSHLSENNNRPELVLNLFAGRAETVTVTIASRYRESEVYKVQSTVEAPRHLRPIGISIGKQMQLF